VEVSVSSLIWLIREKAMRTAAQDFPMVIRRREGGHIRQMAVEQ
jgi:hypothetical protein